MEKGPSSSWPRPVIGALGLLGLAAAAALSHGQPAKAPRWEVGLTVAIKGEYTIRGGGSQVGGTFAYRARSSGRLELDQDGDFLLLRLGTEVLEWRLRETARTGGRESVLEAPPAPKPALRLDYLFKEGAEVEFVFGLEPVSIPLHHFGLVSVLELPRAAAKRPGPPGPSYADCVCRGSCRIAVPAEDFVEPVPERRFSWDWRRERQHLRDGRVLTEIQSHTAEAVVTVVPR